MKEELNHLKERFGSCVVFGEDLSKYSWFNLGGKADIFFRADTKEQLSIFLNAIKKFSKPIYIIGAGSNTLIRDGGVKGVVIKLSSKFSFINKLDVNIIEAGAATLDRTLSNYATQNSIGGFEFLSCIPGSIGGGIIMNSGCYNDEISKIIKSIEILNYDGSQNSLKKKDIEFYYRSTNLKKNSIIVSAVLEGFSSDKKSIEKKQSELINKKKEAQPSNIKTCGSTFKNPPNNKAWKLIQESDCKNLAVGNARISEKHSNFFVNSGNASSDEIETLIEKVKKKVKEKTGVSLELEIKLLGSKK
jgi:UDP-N-acetylmuramate dehydrogenase